MKAAAFALLRLVVSASILAAILSRISIPHPASRAVDHTALYLAAALVLALISIVLVALRWRLLAHWLGLALPPLLAVRALFLGVFGAQLLPSAIGTDLLRGWLVSRHLAGAGRIAASVVADRLVALFAVCLLFTLANPVPKQLPASYAVLLGPAAVLATGTILLVFVLGCGQRPRARPLLGALGLALAVHALSVVIAALAARAFGVDASLRLWVSIVPLAVIASALPISINGWGVREATIVALAAPLGVSAPGALLVSLTIGALNMAASLPGALVMLRAR
ncbi:MAG: lysylphosphatidylglycerol synthase domain-containing protein [Burkholderiales bacterium]